MAFLPVQIFLPFQVDVGDPALFSLEDTVLNTAKTIFGPVLYVYNPSPQTMHVKIVHNLDVDQGDDPLYSGAFTMDVVDDDVPAGKMLVYAFNNVPLTKDNQVAIRHSIELTNLDPGSDPQIYWVLLNGGADVRIQLPASQEIIKE